MRGRSPHLSGRFPRHGFPDPTQSCLCNTTAKILNFPNLYHLQFFPSVPLFYVLRWKRVSRLLMSPCVEVREWVHQNCGRVQLEGLFCSIFGSALPLAMFLLPFPKGKMIIHFLLISLFLSTISDHLQVPLHSNLQLDVHLLPLHLGPCLSRLWPADHSARGHGKVFSRGKWVENQAVSRERRICHRWTCQTLRPGVLT